MARIPLPSRETLPTAELQARWDRMSGRGPVLNVNRLFFTNPGLDVHARQVWAATGLTPRVRELVILRCAYLKQSTYEWHQHVRIATDAGLTRDEIRAVRNWQTASNFSEDERALLAYVDAMAAMPRPGDATFAAMAAGRSPGDVFAITLLVTLYFQLAHIMAALDLETEEPFIGWDAEGT